jgi:glycosyltransferase involved in cell wall biosynthesis
MRIAVWYNLPSGGGKRALYDHVSGLLDRGHEVESWCPPTADQEFLPLGDLIVEHVVPMITGDVVLRRALRNISKGRLGGGAIAIPARLKAMDEHTRRCAREINQSRFDVLFAGSSTEFAVTGLARYVVIPTVLYLQEPARHLYEATPRLPWLALPAGRPRPVMHVLQQLRDATRIQVLRVQAREELESVQAYDRVLANSHFSRESMLRAYGVDAHVCYLGVDTKRYVDRGLPREHLVVGIGSFSTNKRVEVAIEAVAALSAPRPALTWIGQGVDGDYIRSLTGLAERRGVAFTPLVDIPHSQVVDVLNEAAVMVYAPRLEPFGYAPLEAGACGLPVVAKAEGGVRESVIDGETGLLVDKDADLGPALARILGNDALARHMRATARRNVETTWSLDAGIQRLESHLLEVVATR